MVARDGGIDACFFSFFPKIKPFAVLDAVKLGVLVVHMDVPGGSDDAF